MKRSLIVNILFAVVSAIFVSVLYEPTVGVAFGALVHAHYYVPSVSNVLGLNNTNNLSARESYVQAKRMFFRAFRDKFTNDMDCQNYVESLKLSQSEIRIEVGLTTTASNFIFGVTPNQANTGNVQFLTENRLNLQDSLCVNEYGIFVAQTAGNNDTAYKLNSYGNTQAFAAADAAALDSTFFANGNFSVKCNNDVLIPSRGLYNHYYAPQTQQTAALGAGSPKDQQRGAEDGFITTEPNLVLIGSKGYIPELVLKSALASAAANIRAVLIFRGILAQNSTVVS